MHYAIDCNFLECALAMISEGADLYLKDCTGTSAIEMALSPEIENLLKNSYKRNSSISSFVNPFNDLGGTGEGTTYVISDLGDEKISVCDLETFPPKHSSKPSAELKEIFTWLEGIHLEELYEILVEAGYDNSYAMMQQMKGPMPITENDLYEIGVAKAGHRRRILWKLEQDPSTRHIRHVSNGLLKCCSQIRDGTGGIINVPSLLQVFKDIGLDQHLHLMDANGYDNYEILVSQFNSKYALNKEILMKEIGIFDEKAVKKILNRLSSDAAVYKQFDMNFDEGKITACELCNII